jgi:nitroreductase
MDFEEVVRTRFSARMFRPEPVSEQNIRRILELAQSTPSWCNCQPWQVVITRGKATEEFRQKMYERAAAGAAPHPDFAFPPGYAGVYRERRKVCGVQLYQALGIGRDDRASAAEQSLQNFQLFGAPHVAVVTSDESLGVYGVLDCGLYVQTFLLACRNYGVDAIAQAALASYPDLIRELFDLPPSRKVICGISFGYAVHEHAIHWYRTKRATVEEATRFVD